MTKRAFYRQAHRPVLLSVHDVMPENLTSVMGIMECLASKGVFPVTLLIVPGKRWQKEQINILKKWEDRGHDLAAHGWQHQIDRFGSIRHKVHGLLMSRLEAEHLALSSSDLKSILLKSHAWFEKNGLAAPFLYVPPAWAMGDILLEQLYDLPYRLYETFSCVYDSVKKKTSWMALCGYMADNKLRSTVLKMSNLFNQKFLFLPLRIAIHPNDLNLPLSSDLLACLETYKNFTGYKQYVIDKHLR